MVSQVVQFCFTLHFQNIIYPIWMPFYPILVGLARNASVTCSVRLPSTMSLINVCPCASISAPVFRTQMYGISWSGLQWIHLLLMSWLFMMAFLAMVDVLWLRSMADWILSFFPVTPCPLSPLFLLIHDYGC